MRARFGTEVYAYITRVLTVDCMSPSVASWPGSVDSNRHVVNKRHSECLSRCCVAAAQPLYCLRSIAAAAAADFGCCCRWRSCRFASLAAAAAAIGGFWLDPGCQMYCHEIVVCLRAAIRLYGAELTSVAALGSRRSSSRSRPCGAWRPDGHNADSSRTRCASEHLHWHHHPQVRRTKWVIRSASSLAIMIHCVRPSPTNNLKSRLNFPRTLRRDIFEICHTEPLFCTFV